MHLSPLDRIVQEKITTTMKYATYVNFVLQFQPTNLSPDWAVIWGMIVFMLICIIMLVIAVIIWRPKSIGRYPIRTLRPKYKALGAPVPVVPIPGTYFVTSGLSHELNLKKKRTHVPCFYHVLVEFFLSTNATCLPQ